MIESETWIPTQRGFCSLWDRMEMHGELSAKEHILLHKYLLNNIPKSRRKKLILTASILNQYVWPKKEWQARKMWLTKEINKLSKSETEKQKEKT